MGNQLFKGKLLILILKYPYLNGQKKGFYMTQQPFLDNFYVLLPVFKW